MDEFELIDRFFRRSLRHTEVGIGDDTAVVRTTPGTETYIAVDTLVAGRHFPLTSPAAAVGHRAMAVNLSDIAAMGATPRWATLALTMPQVDRVWLADFASGLTRLADEWHVDIVGGDTTEGPLAVTVQVIGEAPAGQRLLRSTAKPGDDVYVSGTPGDAAAGLELVTGVGGGTDADEQYLVDRFLFPTPRLALASRLPGVANACIDVSDGLLADVDHLLEESGVGAEIEVCSLPLSRALLAKFSRDRAEAFALAGGDDYELVFTAPEDARYELNGLDVTSIGRILEQPGLRLTRDGAPAVPPERRGFRHWQAGG